MDNAVLLIRDAAKDFLTAYYQSGEDFTSEEVTTALSELEKTGQEAIAPMCDILDELEARAKARRDKARQYAELAKTTEESVERMKEYILTLMRQTGLDKLSVGEKSITLSKGRESVEVIDEAKVPDTYKRIILKIRGTNIDAIMAVFGDDVMDFKEEVNKTEITAAHKAGVGIAGTQVVRKPYLIIKG